MRGYILIALSWALACTAALAGESLGSKTFLPTHEESDAYSPTVAFGKDVYLVVWQSGSLAPGSIVDPAKITGTGDLVACRVDKSGKALDTKPFVVSGAADSQERPRVAFAGGNFLVVWQDLRNGKDYDVYAARVTPEGKVLDAEGIAVSTGPHNQCNPRVAFDGTNALVVWEDRRSGSYQPQAARITPEGKVLDAQGVDLVGDKRNAIVFPAVASMGGGRSFVYWIGQRRRRPSSGHLFVNRGKVETAVARQDNVYKTSTPTGRAPMNLAAGPKGFLAVWHNHTPLGRGTSGTRNAYAMAVKPDGTLGAPFRFHAKHGYIRNPDAAWDGSAWVAAWCEQVPTYFRRKEPKYKNAGFDEVFAVRFSAEATEKLGPPSAKGTVVPLLAGPLEVSGSFESPARAVAVASDGAGTTLIAYEKHPAKADVPIKIAFRVLRAK